MKISSFLFTLELHFLNVKLSKVCSCRISSAGGNYWVTIEWLFESGFHFLKIWKLSTASGQVMRLKIKCAIQWMIMWENEIQPFGMEWPSLGLCVHSDCHTSRSGSMVAVTLVPQRPGPEVQGGNSPPLCCTIDLKQQIMLSRKNLTLHLYEGSYQKIRNKIWKSSIFLKPRTVCETKVYEMGQIWAVWGMNLVPVCVHLARGID